MERDFKQRLRDSEKLLTEMIRQRDELNVEIIKLQGQIRSVNAVLDFDKLITSRNKAQQTAVGLTEAIRSVLRLSTTPMSAAEVKKSLTLIGFDLSNSSNPSAAVHNTLKRMASTGELTQRGKAYRLLGGFTPLDSVEENRNLPKLKSLLKKK